MGTPRLPVEEEEIGLYRLYWLRCAVNNPEGASGRQQCARQLRGLSQGYSQSINNARNGGIGYKLHLS